MMRVGFELLTKMRHVNAKIMSVLLTSRSSKLPQNLLMRHHLPTVEDEHSQQRVFLRSELNLLARTSDAAGRKIHRDVAKGHGGEFRLGRRSS